MGEAVLMVWLAGTGMTFKPINVAFPTRAACEVNAGKARARGHKATCRPKYFFDIRPCATCGAPLPPVG